MMRFRAILRAGGRAAALEAERETAASIAASIVEYYAAPRLAREAARSWDRAMLAGVDPASVRPAAATNAISRSWDRILPERASPIGDGGDREGRMTMVRPGRVRPGVGAPVNSQIAAIDAISRSWDKVLAAFAPGAAGMSAGPRAETYR